LPRKFVVLSLLRFRELCVFVLYCLNIKDWPPNNIFDFSHISEYMGRSTTIFMFCWMTLKPRRRRRLGGGNRHRKMRMEPPLVRCFLRKGSSTARTRGKCPSASKWGRDRSSRGWKSPWLACLLRPQRRRLSSPHCTGTARSVVHRSSHRTRHYLSISNWLE